MKHYRGGGFVGLLVGVLAFSVSIIALPMTGFGPARPRAVARRTALRASSREPGQTRLRYAQSARIA
jgi:hypothetical protein